MRTVNERMPVDLEQAFRRIATAVTALWPLAEARIKETNPAEHAQLVEYLRLGGHIRVVVHTAPAPAVTLEFIDHAGAPREFYRFQATADALPRPH